MATWRALEEYRRDFGRTQQKEIRKPVDKSRQGFIVGIDAANGLAGFVLQRSERTPFMDYPPRFRLRGGGSTRFTASKADGYSREQNRKGVHRTTEAANRGRRDIGSRDMSFHVII
jgi:hypothetical protein